MIAEEGSVIIVEGLIYIFSILMATIFVYVEYRELYYYLFNPTLNQ